MVSRPHAEQAPTTITPRPTIRQPSRYRGLLLVAGALLVAVVVAFVLASALATVPAGGLATLALVFLALFVIAASPPLAARAVSAVVTRRRRP